MTTAMPTNILNLPDYKVVRVEEIDHDYHITAEASNPPKACVACGSERLIGHGRNEQVIRDMPTHGKRVAIYSFEALRAKILCHRGGPQALAQSPKI